jgi:predicted RND superfamily exporter protein
MPVILVAIGCADGIHIITEYYGRLSEGAEKRAAIIDTMEEISSPVVMTSLTSMAGFGSLVTSSLDPIREFGVFTAFGIFAAMVFSLTFIPAMMMILAPPKRIGRAVERTGERTPLTRLLDWVAMVTVEKKHIVCLAMIPLFAFVVFMTSQVEVGYGFMKDFKKKSEIRISDDMINEKFPGSISINVILDTGVEDGVKDPEFLKRVELLQEGLEENPLVGESTSLVDFINRMNYVMHDNDAEYNRLPLPVERVVVESGVEGSAEEVVEEVRGRDLVAQYILLYENSGGDDMESVVDFEYRRVNVVFQLKTSYSREIFDIQKEAQAHIDELFTGDAEGHMSGVGDLIVIISNYIVRSQLISLVTSICVVLLMLFIVFRSFKAGIFSMLPLVFTILANFTIMRCFGVNLDIATAMIASMALGIGIDYAIHFVTRYRIEVFLKDKTPEEAITETIHTTGRAIIFNALAVAAGFLVLIFSNFRPIINIGWLVAVTMIISSLVTIIVLPSLISLFGLDNKILKNITSLITGALKN